MLLCDSLFKKNLVWVDHEIIQGGSAMRDADKRITLSSLSVAFFPKLSSKAQF